MKDGRTNKWHFFPLLPHILIKLYFLFFYTTRLRRTSKMALRESPLHISEQWNEGLDANIGVGGTFKSYNNYTTLKITYTHGALRKEFFVYFRVQCQINNAAFYTSYKFSWKRCVWWRCYIETIIALILMR